MLTLSAVKTIQKQMRTSESRFPFVFNALSDLGRFRIFQLLLKRHDICVTDVAKILGISVPAASQQLRILEMTGLVRRERMGQMACFEVRKDEPIVQAIIRLLGEFPNG